ncbi:MAG: hypothetical protein LBF12_06805 [Christensenellaceae bacterium]|nr:hypothetical protein [Christensenellaceae bacterium]
MRETRLGLDIKQRDTTYARKDAFFISNQYIRFILKKNIRTYIPHCLRRASYFKCNYRLESKITNNCKFTKSNING